MTSPNCFYHSEDRQISKYEKQLDILNHKISKSQIDAHKQIVDNEIKALTNLQYRLMKEDRLNHATLVRQQRLTRSQTQALRIRQNSLDNKERAMKRMYDAQLENREETINTLKLSHQVAKEKQEYEMRRNKELIHHVKSEKKTMKAKNEYEKEAKRQKELEERDLHTLQSMMKSELVRTLEGTIKEKQEHLKEFKETT